MTNSKETAFKSYYPLIKILSVPSERYVKFYRDRLAAKQANKHDNALDEFGSFLPLNANVGVTEK